MKIHPSSRRVLVATGLSIAVLALAAVLTSTAPSARAEDARTAPTQEPGSATVWPEEVIELFARAPILEAGRVKPLNTYATYALHRMAYRRSCKVPEAGQSGPDAEMRTLTPMEWLLDVLFFPDVAKTYDCFMIEDDAVLNAIGLDRDTERKKKRDRYSYEYLVRGRAKLGQLYGEYHRVDAKERDRVQDAVVALAQHLGEFEMLLSAMDWARRSPFAVPEELRAYFDGAERVAFSELVRRAPSVTNALRERQAAGEDVKSSAVGRAWQGLLRMASLGAPENSLRLFPPSQAQSETITRLVDARSVDPADLHAEAWLNPFLLLRQAAQYPIIPVADEHLAMLEDLESMTDLRRDPAAFAQHARSFDEKGEALAQAMGKGDKIGMEVFLFRKGLLNYPMHFYLFLALPAVMVSWLFSRRKPWYDWLVIAPALAIPTLMLIAGIVIRSIIRQRPPMSTLYDTVLFITAFMVLSAVVIELMNKRRIALFLAPVVGGLGMLVAVGYENLTREDTMPRLVAVLDTNFWLWTHVTAIAIGYAACLFGAVLGNAYVLLKVFGIKKDDTDFFRVLGKMLYGTLAFGLIFTTVGTILGGIWANESWGRFWGWDPKENGALMIVLWQLAQVHARLGGMIKTWGLAMSSAVLGMIVAFSWWGVNLLGIGLHSYGFTSGVSSSLNLWYGWQALVLVIGTIWWVMQRPAPTSVNA